MVDRSRTTSADNHILFEMQKLRTYGLIASLLMFLGGRSVIAQSDSQTLHSPHASLVGIADFDLGLPMGSRIGFPVSLGGNLIGGYQLNRMFTLGLGVGLQGYGPREMLLLPMFVDGRIHFPQKKWTPYASLDMGYALSLRPSARGGFLLVPAVGGRVPLSSNTALSLGVGLRIQQNQFQVDGVFVDYLASYLSVKLGVVVKVPRLSRWVFKKTMHRMKDREKRGD